MRNCPFALAGVMMAALLWIEVRIGASRAEAPRFGMDWYEIGASAGASGAGQFTVSGSLARVESGTTLQGGRFALTSGYWSFITVLQTPGAPRLMLSMRDLRTVTITWPVSPEGFALQQSAALNPPAWANVRETATVSEGFNRVDLTVANGSTFFRLARP